MEEGNYCEICLENGSKYRCPGCGKRTCSVACVKAHKEQSQCSGAVDNTSFVKRSELLENSHLVQRDYNFLTNLDRALCVKRQDSRQNKALKRQRINGNTQGSHQGNQNQVQMKRGVRVRYLPKGMQRSTQNKSSWDKKKQTYVWTVEFQLVDGDTGKVVDTVQSLRVPEETHIGNCIHFKLKEKTDGSSLWCFFKLVDRPASDPALKRLSMDKALADELRGETVIEFPTLVVSTRETVKGYKIIGKNDDGSEEQCEDFSEKSSGSEESSSSEESSEESSDEEQPEEESSKPTDGVDDDTTENTEGVNIDTAENTDGVKDKQHS